MAGEGRKADEAGKQAKGEGEGNPAGFNHGGGVRQGEGAAL